MADITDIKAILYTEKTIELQENGVIVVQTSPRMTKTGLKEVFKEYFGVTPLKVNSLRQDGKVKRFRGKPGKRADFKKFYVTLPEDAQIANLSA
ncbi:MULTISPECIES: 50S ribosomal protein L23 [Arcobacter]|jgi:large subunit ribosomal protein L23|uniref:Large ribosomal subunit protein uL23 n=1 Tax=Arcobacter ellisii TaxID=913109 RepID=A0A347U6V3_9BACT|nr:50S ribosomal protein L23 [Arcobacter ellisii]AXX94581.1 50S ribosomal protein L23 [Arcobacter ellisii]MBD3828877.1 50S ribosomal protein L23 [Arcobacter sp.]MDY0050943.1 50S ribosomal protein L23 [Aliarcobacter sp.]RXI29201.1 50S ribosomal protein L23 [Arcobacter ellisii]